MRILRHLPARPAAPVALTIGNFDGVHLGHRAMVGLLIDAARRRQLASCVMTFEPHPREFFAPDRAPTRLTSLREKLELLAQLGVDQVHVRRFDYDFARIAAETFIEEVLVEGLGVRWVLVGDDFRFGARRQGDAAMLRDALARRAVEVAQMQTVLLGGTRVSSTAVRERLACGDLHGAAQLLGRPYSISGRVVAGERLGKRLGFPTANLQMRHNRPPLAGIFVVEVLGLGQRPLEGVASLGVRPTVKDGGAPVLEVHLLDFARDIYGQHLQVRFLHKLREEEKFAGLDILQRQIAKDVEDARRFFRRAGRGDQRENIV
ncbi:MAG TPA: bifunctional riboflavin kinase/FAD synthetase [Burkholderiales bacterium]|nr:bifunctional riboflavin kinase/FAD synthetase [Burkholderiales bacterium]